MARQLLDEDVVAVLASDGHNSGARRPVLAEAFEYISEHYGESRAKRLMLHNPATIVARQFEQQAGAPC